MARSLKKGPFVNYKLQRKIDVMKVAILNKEYVNLSQKLQFIKKNGFDLAFSHHHDVDAYLKQTGVRFYFLPFGFNQRNFKHEGEIKDIDLMFCLSYDMR